MPPITLPPISVPPGAAPPPPPAPPAPGPVLPITSEHRTGNDACIKRLAQLHMEPAPKVYPMPCEPGTGGQELDVQTNVFGIEVHKSCEIYQYSVHIKAEAGKREVVFTKKGKEDFVVVDRHKKCTALLFHTINKYVDFFQTDNNCFVYDGQSLLYSTINIFEKHPELNTKYFEIHGGETDQEDLFNIPCIKIEVFPTKNSLVKFNQDDIGRRTSDSNIEVNNRAYHQIMELALNQSCIRDTSRCVVFEHGKLFFIKPLEEGYVPEDMVEVGDGKLMMPGIKKTIQFIEGPYGRGQNNPSVVIDGMKVAFHKEQPLADKLLEVGTGCNLQSPFNTFDKEKINGVIKGLDCYTTHGTRRQHVKIDGLYHESPTTARFEIENKGTCTVKDYFLSKYNVTLQYPNANLIVCKQRGKQNFYPIEVLTVTPNQRVTIAQQTAQQSQRTTKESAVLPDVRQRLIMTGKLAAQITQENPVLKALGISVCDEPLMTKARQLPSIKIQNTPSGASAIARDGKWRINGYLRPAKFPGVWAMYCVGNQSTRFSADMLKKFAVQYVEVFQQKGVNVPPPSECLLVAANQIEERLKKASESKCKFVFVITDDHITALHQRYKHLENQYGMVIQDMRLSKATSVINQGKKLTLENVINKSNVKLGGSNYMFHDTKKYLDNVLAIGVGVSHPPPGTKFALHNKGMLNPQVLGFAYNGKEEQEFYGDFLLSPGGQDTFAPIEDIVSIAITGYKKFHGDVNPKRVIVFRSGASEGNHGPIMAYEVPLALAACQSFSLKIQLIYIAVSKDHTFRFFNQNLHSLTSSSSNNTGTSVMSGSSRSSARPCDLNVGPGLMIDSYVTNPACKQFFLNSHNTLQGSAKTPLYTVLYDDSKSTMTSLEEMTYNLCHLHQIVGLTTSLPTPLYVANEYAKRGRNLWNEANIANPSLRDSGAENQLQRLTNDINYSNSDAFRSRRVNA